MKGRAWLVLAGILAALALVAAGCGGNDDEGSSADGGTTTEGSAPAELDKVTLQLKWVTQAQFAGYYAALGAGLLQGRGARRDAEARRPGHHARAGRARAARPSSGSTGCRRCSRPATRAATSSTSRRSSTRAA